MLGSKNNGCKRWVRTRFRRQQDKSIGSDNGIGTGVESNSLYLLASNSIDCLRLTWGFAMPDAAERRENEERAARLKLEALEDQQKRRMAREKQRQIKAAVSNRAPFALLCPSMPLVANARCSLPFTQLGLLQPLPQHRDRHFETGNCLFVFVWSPVQEEKKKMEQELAALRYEAMLKETEKRKQKHAEVRGRRDEIRCGARRCARRCDVWPATTCTWKCCFQMNSILLMWTSVQSN